MCELPEEVIRQVQICSRAAAGLPEYDPEDQRTIDDPTQQLDQQLRCLSCNGEKLNIRCCVYCGRLNDDVIVPDSISFKSTIAYHWLLTSLTLHGSEIVRPPINKTERDHEQRSEIPLCDFLNFRVARAEATSISAQLVEKNSKSSSLTGFRPDFFVFKNNKDASSTTSSEHPILDNQIFTIREASAHDSPDLPQAGTSLKDERTQVFSEWEADFQFADAEKNQNHVSSSSDHTMDISADILQDSESFDHTTVLEVDLSAHMDSLFGGAKNVSDEQPKDKLTASSALSDWNLDELGTTVSSSEAKINTTNDHHKSVDLFDDFQRKTNNTHAIENSMVVEEQMTIKDDSFDEWNEFTGSRNLEEPSGNVENELQNTNTCLTENTTYLRENMTINDDSIDEWNDFTGSTSLQNPSKNVQNELQTNATSITITVNTTNSEEDRAVNDYTADVWNDFPGSCSLQDPSTKFWNGWQTDDVHVTEKSTRKKEHNTIKNDLLDDWNGFAGSRSLQEFSGNTRIKSQIHDTCVTENTTTLENNEAINDEWDDFIGSNNSQVPSINVENQLQTCDTENTKKLEENGAMDDEWDGFTGSTSIQDPPTNIWNEWQINDTPVTENITLKKDSFDEWNDFTGSSSLQIPSEYFENESQEKDTNGTRNTAMPQEIKAKNDDPSGESNGFTGSSILLDNSRNFQNELQTNDSHVTENMAMSNGNKMIKENSFDEWNDFTGSCIQVPTENVHTELHKNNSNITDNTNMLEDNKEKHDDPIDQWNCFSASNGLQDPSVNFWNQWQTNDPRVTEHMTKGEEHETINDDEWNDFRGTGGLREPSGNVEIELQINNNRNTENLIKPNENKTINNEIIDEWDYFTSSNSLQDTSTNIWNEWQTNDNLVIENTMTSKENKRISYPFDELNAFTGSSSLPDPSANVWKKSNDFPISNEGSAENVMFSSNSKFDNVAEHFWSEWQVDNTPVPENTLAVMEDKTENDDSLDEWNDFTGAGSLQDSSLNVGNVLQTNDTLVTETAMTGKERMTNDDPFDEWNDFTNSSNLKNSSGSVGNGNSEVSVSETKSAEIDIFSFSLENLYFTSMSKNIPPTK